RSLECLARRDDLGDDAKRERLGRVEPPAQEHQLLRLPGTDQPHEAVRPALLSPPRSPTRGGSGWAPPELGRMPSSTSGRPNVAVSSAIRKSVASASSSPPPRHQPWMAAIVGMGSAAIRS